MSRVFKTSLKKRMAMRKRRAAWSAEEKERNRKALQAWRKNNKERLSKANSVRQKQFSVEIRLQRKGLDVSLADKIKSHNGRCDICRRPRGDRRWKSLHIDHKKKVFRGMLCSNCNRGLGYFLDNPKLLKKAAIYLERITK